MIFELAIGAGAAAAVAYALKTIRNRRAPPPSKEDENKVARNEPRGLQLGDVLLYGDAELWLNGRLELREEGEFVLRLFRAPGNTTAEWVLQLDAEATELALLSAADLPKGKVPTKLPHKGIRHRLTGRGKVTLTYEGEDVPHGSTGDYAVLEGTAGRTLFILEFDGKDARLALAGERVPREMLEHLPGEIP